MAALSLLSMSDDPLTRKMSEIRLAMIKKKPTRD